MGIEPRADRRALAAANALALGTPALRLLEGVAPEALAGLPAPDAVFFGGGLSLVAVEAAVAALTPVRRLVANAVTLESERCCWRCTPDGWGIDADGRFAGDAGWRIDRLAAADAGDTMGLGEAMMGRLYGVGLGPGAPDLMTLRAARLIGAAQVIAYPTLAGAPSFARAIAAELIPAGAEEIVIDLPMTVERAPSQAGYDRGAVRIADRLTAGLDVVVLCEGDPFFYGSFMYLHARLAGRFAVEVVPGVTSITAAAARAGRPLVARNERLEVLPGPLPDTVLRERIAGAEAVAIMKIGRHLPRIRAVIDGLGLTDRAVYVERATLAEEVVLPLAQAPDTAPYFSLILLTKGADPWL